LLFSQYCSPILLSQEAPNFLRRILQIGFNIPSTLITNDPKKAHNFYQKSKGNMILKVLHHDIEIHNKLYSSYSHQAKENDLLRFSDLVYAPSILQEKLSKQSELRVTVTVVDDQVFAAEIKTHSLRCPR
jgi:glutathione synthase/RimK-type ligase-like ATP-grasp enzyme